MRKQMILQKFNCTVLRERLEKLDTKAQLAFGAICCERLLPNYLAFIQEVAWGNIVFFRDALDLVWSYIAGKKISIQEIKNNLSLCESVITDADDFPSLYASVARDACFSVCYLLEYLIEKNINAIVYIATYATDSVDMYVQVIEDLIPNSLDLEQRILEHPLMQRELLQQQKDIELVEKVGDVDSKFLNQLRNSWENNGKSNLDLP
jgi:uncharacterized protein